MLKGMILVMKSTNAVADVEEDKATPTVTEPNIRRVVKVTTNLPVAVFDVLRELADERATTMTEVLRQAISTERFFTDAVERKETILLESPDGQRVREVFFKR